MALREQIKEAMKTDSRSVGLADNGHVKFQCGTCEYFEAGVCHNKHPKLMGVQVNDNWCCNLYDHDGMKTVIE